jgi:ATP-dependent Lon protease
MIPEENAKDLADIPDSVKNSLEIIPVSGMDEVLKHALTRQPEAIEWDESAAENATKASTSDDDATGVVAH